MRCKGLSFEDASRLIAAWLADPSTPIDAEPFVKTFGDGEDVDEESLDYAASRLNEDVASFKAEGKTSAAGKLSANFDAEAAEIIHRAMPDDAGVLGRPEFWWWLAVVKLREVIAWRFPGKLKADEGGGRAATNLDNFGLAIGREKRYENYAYKLWCRAESGVLGNGADAYRFVKRGDVDFWTSHILRPRYASNRELARALVHFQFPDALGGKPLLLAGQETKGRRGMRTLAKLIVRLQANVEFAVLDRSDLDRMLRRLARDLNRADGGSFVG
jgi:hypothetical protein